MFHEVDDLVAEGAYEKAFAEAKRRSIEFLKKNRRDTAAVYLARTAEILCSLNNPSKARTFAWEALDLARRADNAAARAYSLSVLALASLRLGEIEKAEQSIDAALDLVARESDSEFAAFSKLVAAEISLSKEDTVEARAFAEDAFAIGAARSRPDVKARACLIKALSEERMGSLPAAIELLATAEAELARHPNIEILWQTKSAMASVCMKADRRKVAMTYRQEAADLIQKVSMGLSPEAKDRFLKNPAIATAFGKDTSESGIFKVPLQASPEVRTVQREELSLAPLRPVLEVIKKINTEQNIRKLLTMIVDTMIEFCNARRGTIVVFEQDSFKIEISRNREKEDLKQAEMGLSRDVLKSVRDTGQKIMADHASEDPNLKLSDSVHDQNLLSILCVPLRVKLRLIGAVYLDNSNVVGAFGSREVELAEVLTDHAAVAIDNALLRAKSIHDGLTHLFNHGHFEKRLEAEVSRSRRHGRMCGLLMIDMDDFKSINDTYGHEGGNEALRTISNILVNITRNADLVARVHDRERDITPVVARFGGDEFEVILPEAGREGIRIVADRLLQAIKTTPFRWKGEDHLLAISIGGASFPEDAKDHRELILRADEALYAAKAAGKNQFALFKAPAPLPTKSKV